MSDWRRALGVYVAGRSRAIEHDRKRSLGQALGETAGQADVERPSSPPPEPRFGVAVPDRLAFHRNAGNWRDRLPQAGTDDRD